MFVLHREVYWEHVGVAGSLGVSVFVILCLLLRIKETTGPRMYLWAMLAFFTVNLFDGVNWLAYSGIFAAPTLFYRWNDVIIPGFMVSLYFYVRALTSAQPALEKRDLLHSVPFLVAGLCLAPALILPGQLRQDPEAHLTSERHLALLELGETAFWCFWILLLAGYGGLCIRRLVYHKRNVRSVFSDLNGKTLRWLDLLVATILVLALIVIVDEIRLLFEYSSLRDGVWSLIYDVVLPLSFGIFAIRATPVLPDWSKDVLGQPDQAKQVMSVETSPPQRYARSGLQPEDLERLASRLERRMREGRLWRNHSLNLRGLAAEISVPAIHLSEVLNMRLGMTFYDYVNQCRVRDACDLLVNSNDTILDISETVGFNAKSTFNTSFKKLTQQTPSQWRAQHRA